MSVRKPDAVPATPTAVGRAAAGAIGGAVAATGFSIIAAVVLGGRRGGGITLGDVAALYYGVFVPMGAVVGVVWPWARTGPRRWLLGYLCAVPLAIAVDRLLSVTDRGRSDGGPSMFVVVGATLLWGTIFGRLLNQGARGEL
jgi:hypothetical protein